MECYSYLDKVEIYQKQANNQDNKYLISMKTCYAQVPQLLQVSKLKLN